MRIIRFDNLGWRARFDDGFNEKNVARAAAALGRIWAEAQPGATVYVGYDTRYNGLGLARVVGGVLSGMGMRAIIAHTACPTPALGWTVAHDEAAVGGIMLTASSASSDYGGISARLADGGPVSEDFYEVATQLVTSSQPEVSESVEYADVLGRYRASVLEQIDVHAIADFAPSVVVDPLYGSARGVLASMLRSVGCRVLELHGDDVPDFGGLHPSPSEPWVDKAEQAVRQRGYDGAIVLDGDGDRLGLVDERGRFVTPHLMEALILEHLVHNRGQHGRVVATWSSSAYIRRQANRLDCAYTPVPMGFTRIYGELVDRDVLMGCEELGGVAYPDHLAERDGILSAMLLVEYLAMSGEKIGNLVGDLVRNLGELHYINRDIRLDAASIQSFRNILPGLNLSKVCGKTSVSIGHADGLLLRFDDDSWVQLRPSRTKPVVRACAEAHDKATAKLLAEETCAGALSQLPR